MINKYAYKKWMKGWFMATAKVAKLAKVTKVTKVTEVAEVIDSYLCLTKIPDTNLQLHVSPTLRHRLHTHQRAQLLEQKICSLFLPNHPWKTTPLPQPNKATLLAQIVPNGIEDSPTSCRHGGKKNFR